MEPKGSIPNSQELSTCPYPQADQSSPHHPIYTRLKYSWVFVLNCVFLPVVTLNWHSGYLEFHSAVRFCSARQIKHWYKLRGLSPLENYTNRKTATCRRSWCQLLRIEGAMRLAWRILTAVFLAFWTGAATISSKQLLSCTHETEWTLFQTHYFSESLVAPGIQPGPLDLLSGTLTTRPLRR
jgi:hypothetical protein